MSRRRLTDVMVTRVARAKYLKQARATNHHMAKLENRRAHPPMPWKELSEAERKAWRDGARDWLSVAMREGWRPTR